MFRFANETDEQYEARKAKALDADIRCRQYLAKATDARDAGEQAKAETYEAKAQYWLDRQNKLEGNT